MIKKLLQRWLEIEKPKDWANYFDDLLEKYEQELWKIQQVIKPIVLTKCAKCGQEFKLWPYEEAAYYILAKGKFEHKDCPHQLRSGK